LSIRLIALILIIVLSFLVISLWPLIFIIIWSILIKFLFRGIILVIVIVIVFRCKIGVDFDDLSLIGFLYLLLKLSFSSSALDIILPRLSLLLQDSLNSLFSLIELFLFTSVLSNWLLNFILVFFGLTFVVEGLKFLFTQSGLLSLS
jgi:hypothetical protein